MKPVESPYPGLRPFQRHEAEIFFGREEQTEKLLERLGEKRFLAVVGPSGCGKSSLVNAGMIPALENGFLLKAGDQWRIAPFRPGSSPIRHLAQALHSALFADASGSPNENADEAVSFISATLRRGSMGIVEAFKESRVAENTNLLVLADQFEEIFRYRKQYGADEAEHLVNLLLAAAAEKDVRVYVAMTMRSDFLGDCALFMGLPEAMNDSQFLTPRMTREQRRAAIAGPAALFGGTVEPELVNKLLNDMGADPDQLPLMQHALMRMWTISETKSPALQDYEAIGGIENALSNHADKAHAELTPKQQKIAEILFKCLTERMGGIRDTRRPVRLAEPAAIAGVSVEDAAEVVDVFRKKDRCFLTTPTEKQLDADAVVDISHESLIRQWKQLNHWANEEAESAENYKRLEDAAIRHENGKTALWGTPDLEIALDWKEKTNPTPEWAERYGKHFNKAILFLKQSEQKQQQDKQNQIRQRRLALDAVNSITYEIVDDLKEIPRTLPIVSRILEANMATLDKIYALYPDTKDALREKFVNLSKMGDIWLLLGNTEKALKSYQSSLEISQRLAQADPTNTQAQRDVYVGLNRLGDVNLQLGDTQAALTSYQAALEISQRLAQADPTNTEAQYDLSVSYERMGYIQKVLGNIKEANISYTQTISITKKLTENDPSNTLYFRELSIGHSKLGDVNLQLGDTQAALTSYKASHEILQRLAQADPTNTHAQRDVSVSFERLGDVNLQLGDTQAALTSHQAALEISQRQAQADPTNTEAQRDVSVSYNKQGRAYESENKLREALQMQQNALTIVKKLSETDPTNYYVQSDLSEFRGVIDRLRGDELLSQNKTKEALELYHRALDNSEKVWKNNQGNRDARDDTHSNCIKIAKANEILNEPETALKYYRKALEIAEIHARDKTNIKAQDELKSLREIVDGFE